MHTPKYGLQHLSHTNLIALVRPNTYHRHSQSPPSSPSDLYFGVPYCQSLGHPFDSCCRCLFCCKFTCLFATQKKKKRYFALDNLCKNNTKSHGCCLRLTTNNPRSKELPGICFKTWFPDIFTDFLYCKFHETTVCFLYTCTYKFEG